MNPYRACFCISSQLRPCGKEHIRLNSGAADRGEATHPSLNSMQRLQQHGCMDHPQEQFSLVYKWSKVDKDAHFETCRRLEHLQSSCYTRPWFDYAAQFTDSVPGACACASLWCTCAAQLPPGSIRRCSHKGCMHVQSRWHSKAVSHISQWPFSRNKDCVMPNPSLSSWPSLEQQCIAGGAALADNMLNNGCSKTAVRRSCLGWPKSRGDTAGT